MWFDYAHHKQVAAVRVATVPVMEPAVVNGSTALTTRRGGARPVCLCGTVLVTDAVMDQWVCGHCGRAFCRDCGGPLMRAGGCDTCTVCGAGMCG